jgi:hypothetical protein
MISSEHERCQMGMCHFIPRNPRANGGGFLYEYGLDGYRLRILAVIHRYRAAMLFLL